MTELSVVIYSVDEVACNVNVAVVLHQDGNLRAATQIVNIPVESIL